MDSENDDNNNNNNIIKRNSIVVDHTHIEEDYDIKRDLDEDGEAVDAQSMTESLKEEIDEREEEEEEEEEEPEIVKPSTVSFEIRTPSGKKYLMNDIPLETTVREIKEMVASQDDNYAVGTIKLIKVCNEFCALNK